MNLCAEEIEVGLEEEFEGSRVEKHSFERAMTSLEEAIVAECRRHDEWPAKVAAGINVVIDFLIANPGAARAILVDSRTGEAGDDGAHLEMIGRFAGLLGDGAPRSERLPASNDRSIVSVIAAIVSCHVRAGTVPQLKQGDPDLTFLALLPYLGFAEAGRWSVSMAG